MNSAGTTIGIIQLDEMGIVEGTGLGDLEKVKAILKKHGYKKEAMVTILLELKEELGSVPEDILEFVGKELDVPVERLCSSLEEGEEGVCVEEGVTYYPRCRDCDALLTEKPFTDTDTVIITTLWCPKCGKENSFYIDLERMFRPKNKWCPNCRKFSRNYTQDHTCVKCGTEVYRTKSRTDTSPAVEFYPRCPDCRKVLTQKPYTDINTVTVAEFYCSNCDKNHWFYIDLEKIYS
jgi:hypothetical protein